MKTPKLHFPPAEGWHRGEPAALGFDPVALNRAVNYATTSEIDWPVDVGAMVARNDPPPHNRPIGPTKPRGSATGVVVKDGLIGATWGTPERVDMTFSATKSYLSSCVGLALDRGLIGSVDDLVRHSVGGDLFAGKRNGAVTWRHLLQQTSEWAGTLFGIPDTVDHYRRVNQAPGDAAAPTANLPRKGTPRTRQEPGAFWEYNDVRVNALALAALHVWREPLPTLLRREIMAPIGATASWQWHGYDRATVEIDGKSLASVPGGGHWGGGLWINTFDHARYALLMLARGRWHGGRVLSEGWIEAATTPCSVNNRYGFLWWLNSGGKLWPKASRRAFAALGAGGHLVFVEPQYRLVVVARWAGDSRGIVDRVIAALR